MTPKVLAIDLDGTLVRRDRTIAAADIDAIRRVREAGVAVSIVTGRLYSGSIGAARVAGVEGPIACVDGSQIVDTRDDRRLCERPLTGLAAATLRDVLDRHGPASFLFDGDDIVHDATGQPFTSYLRTWSPRLAEVERVSEHASWEDAEGLLAVVAVGAQAEIEGAAAAAREALADAAFVVSFPLSWHAGAFAMMVRAAGATKGTAIEWLARHHGCAPSEVVAVGDWVNDATMFAAAGRSFAMGHAPDRIKAAATDVLKATEAAGGGIAEAVHAVWPGQVNAAP